LAWEVGTRSRPTLLSAGYWLDNRALQSAIETNHLSPDAYDIDISFNVQDLERSNAMKKSQSKPYVDNEGFYWIKATDGHYFRVQFSKPNQVGVNLLPYAITGTEAKPSGFLWLEGLNLLGGLPASHVHGALPGQECYVSK